MKQCVDSIAKQTYTDLEIILVDDGSKDRSFEIAESLAKEDSRILILKNPENMGVSATRNHALRAAKGEYVQFVDSDDYIDAQMTERMVEESRKYHADLVICGAKLVQYQEDEIISESSLCQFPAYPSCMMDNHSFLSAFGSNMQNNVMITVPIWNKLYKTDTIKTANASFQENLSYGEDLIFNTKVFLFCKNISLIDQDFYAYTVHNKTSLVQGYKAHNFYAHILIGEAMEKMLKEANVFTAGNQKGIFNWLAQNMVESLFEYCLAGCPLTREEKIAEINKDIRHPIIKAACEGCEDLPEMYIHIVSALLKGHTEQVLDAVEKCFSEHYELFAR